LNGCNKSLFPFSKFPKRKTPLNSLKENGSTNIEC
jgi:hypothetical protein